MKSFEKYVEQGLLFDFYGELLTEHQREVYADFVLHNLSLSEIAEEKGISRQGVHDLVKRCEKILAGYEHKLQLMKKFLSTKEQVQKINQLAEEYQTGGPDSDLVRQIGDLSGELLKEL